jgi:hypothetical protein
MILMSIIALVTIPPLALLLAILMAVLNIKKKLSSKGKRRWAFFHPFWYHSFKEVTMEEAAKRCFGV